MAARTTFKISDDVRDVLARSTITATSAKLPDGQLERKLYEAVNKALEGAGGRWDRKSKTHLFDRDPREALGLAVETGKALNLRTKLQAFYTPPEIAEKMVAATGIAKHRDVVRARAGDRFARPLALEPSVGEGALAVALIKASAGQVALTACDTDEVALKAAEPAIVAAYKAEGVKSPTCQIHTQDFLLVSAHDSVRLVHREPVQATTLEVVNDDASLKARFAALAVRLRDAADTYSESPPIFGLFFEAAEALDDAIAFRDIVAIHNTAVEDIPPGTFKHTGIATVMLVLRKPTSPSGR